MPQQELFPPQLAGRRDFDYITPKGRRLTEYEAVTCYTQTSTVGGGLQVCGDYRTRPDGRPMYDVEASAVRMTDWYGYRDPNQMWQKPYYRMQADVERGIDRVTDVAIRTGTVHSMSPQWLSVGLVRGLLPMSYAEYGMFRAINVAARESMSDTVNNVLVFNAADKLRHAQAIAIYGLDLEGPLDGFDGTAGKDVWVEDASWQPVRELVESIMAIQDWMEIVVAVTCGYEALLAQPLRLVVFSRIAAGHGDSVTPAIESGVIADYLRNSSALEALFDYVASDPAAGRRNAELLHEWRDRWTERTKAAATTLFQGLEDELSELGLAEQCESIAKGEATRIALCAGAMVGVSK